MERGQGLPCAEHSRLAMASLLAKAEPISHMCGAGKTHLRKSRKHQIGRTGKK